MVGLGIEINDEDLIYLEYFGRHARYGPREQAPISPMTGVAGLPGGPEVVGVLVRKAAPIVGKTLQAANDENLLVSAVLVVRIDRDGEAFTPTGETTIQEDDFVTIHSRSGISDGTLRSFFV